MAKSIARSNNETEGQNINLVSNGTQITGDIITDGDIRMDGELKGNINARGRLVVGANGKIEGEINCNNVEVSGEVKGKITARELLNMKSSSRINGEIITGKLAVEPGAAFTGNCTMENRSDGPEKAK